MREFITKREKANLLDAYCSGCEIGRSADPSLDATTRTPCPACGASSLTYKRRVSGTATACTSVSYLMTPGDQARSWQFRWRMIESALMRLEQFRQNPVQRSTIEDAERQLLDFYVTAYHLKDALIQDRAVAKQDVEDAVTASAALSLLADVANLDKHHKLNLKRYRPRSGHVPVIKSRAAASGGTGWRLVLTIEHNCRDLDGLVVAREARDAWDAWLQTRGLL